MTEARNTAETWQRRAEKAEAQVRQVREQCAFLLRRESVVGSAVAASILQALNVGDDAAAPDIYFAEHVMHLVTPIMDGRNRAEAAVQRVRELHYAYDAMDRRRRCGCCGHPWPCLTALAVDGDSDEDGAE